MIPITIDAALQAAAPNLALGVINAVVEVTQHDSDLWGVIDARTKEIQATLKLEELPNLSEIKALRDTYRALGKDPSRYRGSQEALLRRILKGQGLYRVNTVVDINNLVSIESRFSTGSYNLDRLKPPLVFRKGNPGESYQGIGKDLINTADLPVFADALGPFGSPTSDSERSKITPATNALLMVIIFFGGPQLLFQYIERATELLTTYARASRELIETAIIK